MSDYGTPGMDALAKQHGFGEPAPKKVEGPSMHDLVIEDMARRKDFGLAKYGTPLQAGNGRNALQDAYEEVLDLAVYLRQRIEEDRASHEVIAFGAEAAVRRVPVGEVERCGATGPFGGQCIGKKGHEGQCRVYNFDDVKRR